MLEYIMANGQTITNFETFLNAVVLNKCFNTRLWHDTTHIFKQFNRIGTTLSQHLVNADITTFKKMLQLNPRRLEAILNKSSPFGNHIMDTIAQLPLLGIEFARQTNYQRDIDRDTVEININCVMKNYDIMSELENGGCLGLGCQIIFILGDEFNNLLASQRLK